MSGPTPAPNLAIPLELSVSASGLENRDATSKSDPLCVLFLKDASGRFAEVGRTERLKNTLSPAWAKSFSIDYHFEEKQTLKFQIFDSDSSSSNLSAHDFLGELECSVGEIVGSPVKPFSRSLVKRRGVLSVVATETGAAREIAAFRFSARNLDKKDLFGKSDPFFVVSRPTGDRWTVVHRSEVVKETLNPEWRPFEIGLSKLCQSDRRAGLQFQVFDWDSDGGHDLIGSFLVSFAELEKAAGGGAPAEFPVVNEKKRAKKGAAYKGSGTMLLQSLSIRRLHSFVDFLQGGTSLHFTVAVDFTGSNGHPSDPRSLHRHGDASSPNQYVQAVRAVGEVVQDYDADKMFPALGFGAKLPDGTVSHEFFLNGHPTNPYCQGVEGVLHAYGDALRSVQLYGPTNFSPVINHVARFAAAAPRDAANYFVLLIVTDGIITDMEETMSAIVKASYYPMSIIIVGVGEADFSAMSVLDGDGRLLRSFNETADRDIVQFVKFSDFCVVESGGAGATPTLFVQNQAKLAKAVLAEIPGQLTEYMSKRGFAPVAGAKPEGH